MVSLMPSDVVRQAWKKSSLNQRNFAKQHGITQYNLSRYASGKVKPPENLLMQCMHMLGMFSHDDVSAEELAELIQRTLSRPDQAIVRRAIYDLLATRT